MHDIKFRAWDNLEKRMRKVVSLHWRDGKLVSAKLEGENEPIPIEGRLVIEQFTGLSDKNGVEICAGDILKSKIYGENVPPNTYTSRLVFIEMKRKKGGVTSLNEAGIQTVVYKGCDAAIEFIESITK